MHHLRPLLLSLCLISLFSVLSAQQLVGDWTFHPNYTLFRNAENYPGHKIDPPKSRFELFKTLGPPLYFHEQHPTQRLTNFLANENIPRKAFSVELWLLNHVNMPVGATICLRQPKLGEQVPWLLGYYQDEVAFHVSNQKGEQETIRVKVKQGWKKYWGHLVATFDGNDLRLYLNGELLESATLSGPPAIDDESQIELAGYFSHEPYMEISNLVKSCRLHAGAIQLDEIQARFQALQAQVEQGALFPDTLHFNAGPYLHYATQESINILWETDQMTTATVAYGTTLPLQQEKRIEQAAYIQEITLDNLQVGTPYYYEIRVEAADGQQMSSGLLTFGTAGQENDPFSFCILGDTESRPHINHRLGEMIWEERPNFILHLGDITDGGKAPHKFEWNYEYFTGIVPVASRIPVFPVPGNGEGDLYWYERYHRLPSPEAYYTFRYGAAEFFMLNTNASAELVKGGKQYEWLKQQLAASQAKWKFVAHHHCPVSSDENDFGDTWKGATSTNGDPKFDDLKALYENAQVDIVFFGHVHSYERTYPLKDGIVDAENGVIYLKSGGAGGNLEDFAPTHNAYSGKIQRGHHFCKVDLFDDQLTLKMYNLEGMLKDVFELKK